MRNRFSGQGTNRKKEICGVTEVRPGTCARVDPLRLRWQPLRRGVLLYNVANDETFETNKVGLQIVQRLDGRHTCGQVAEYVRARYSLPALEALADVSQFLAELDRHGFVQWI